MGGLIKALIQGTGFAARAKLIPIDQLESMPNQPRKRLAEIEALAESVRSEGILQPLLVRPLPDEPGRYQVIAGHRRLAAARLAGLSEAPAIILEVDEERARQIAMVENLQREDLNPFEETLGILALLALELGKTQAEVEALLHRMRDEARGKVPHNVVGNSSEKEKVEALFRQLGRMSWESFVQHRLPLLRMPEDLTQALIEGSIPYTAALALKRIKDDEKRRELLEAAKAGMPVRELQERVKEAVDAARPSPGWYREAVRRLGRVKPERLPEEKRRAFEQKLRELLEILGD